MEIEKPIHMRVLAEDLSTYLKSSSDPLGVLKTINSLPGTSWDFQIRLSDKTAPELLITLPNGVAYSDLLDGTIPELHWCSKILISSGEDMVEVEPYTGKFLNSLPSQLNSNQILLKDFGGSHLIPVWGDHSKIRDYLIHNTWLGVPNRERSRNQVNWKYIAKDNIFESDELISASSLGENVALQTNSFAIDIYERPGSKETEIYDLHYGNFTNRTEFKPLIDAIKRRGLSGALIVLSKGWQFDMGPFGVVRPLERIESVIQEFKIEIVDTNKFSGWTEKRRHRKEVGEAARLSLRLENAKNAQKVFYKNALVGTVPTSEAGAAAIFHKLEALGGIPFAKFSTIAWASSDGIDAIADIQFDINEPVGHLLPIEYEFKFENFLSHQHPHGHVHLVVCWFKSSLLTASEKPWLYTYKDAKFKVLVISAVPDLKIL